MTTLIGIVRVPATEDMDALPAETRAILDSLIVRRQELPLSQTSAGYRVVIVCFNNPNGDDPLPVLNAMIAAHSLDWEILRLQDWSPHTEDDGEGNPVSVVTTYKSDGDVTPYLVPQPLVDAEGTVTGTYTPALGIMSGQSAWQ